MKVQYPFPKLISVSFSYTSCSPVLYRSEDNNLGNAGGGKKRFKKSILPSKIKVSLSRGETIIIFKCVCQRTINKLSDIARNNKIDICLRFESINTVMTVSVMTSKYQNNINLVIATMFG